MVFPAADVKTAAQRLRACGKRLTEAEHPWHLDLLELVFWLQMRLLLF